MTVLVAYASAHGSTRSIAGRIGTVPAERGLQTDVRPMAGVEDAGAYEAFVLGSEIRDWPRIDAWASTIKTRPRASARSRPGPADLGGTTRGPGSLVADRPAKEFWGHSEKA
ncbi:hypothetical protein GWI34_02460 [Actinomadura sp. DSM 109109]|nr:hypothetical protein [Actinomadura lepetitiana]